MTRDKDDDIIDKLQKGAEFVSDFLDENEELVERIKDMGGSGDASFQISDREPLTQLEKNEDEVVLVMEVDPASYDEAVVSNNDGDLMIRMGDKTYKAELPDDANFDKFSYNYNNGVLEARVPREETEKGFNVETQLEDEEMDDSESDNGGE